MNMVSLQQGVAERRLMDSPAGKQRQPMIRRNWERP